MLYSALQVLDYANPRSVMSSPRFSEPAGATPAMRQYFDAKRQYRDAIVFFRMGDFYEMFYEDALVAARALELTLTSRSKDSTGGAHPDVRRALSRRGRLHRAAGEEGFPGRDLRAGRGSAEGEGLVRREVVRVVSPGTLTDAGYLDAREPAFLMAIAPDAGTGFGVALLDLSTGEFTAAEYHGRRGAAGARRRARRAAAARDRRAGGFDDVGGAGGELRRACARDAGRAGPSSWNRHGARCSTSSSADSQGSASTRPAAVGCRRLVHYLRDTQKADLAHVREIAFRAGADCLLVDPTTLQAPRNYRGGGRRPDGSLLHEIDRTMTSMGGRLLRSWLLVRWSRSSGSGIGSMPSKSWRFGAERASCARRSSPSSISNGWSRARRSARRAP